jgi:hypothetical protein
MQRLVAYALFALALLPGASRSARAQGGPPLLTDDPGTPGPGRWEVNLAITAERRDSIWLFESPTLDFNYGWGERIQLNLEVPWVVQSVDGAGSASGLGNSRVGVKWRFLGSDTGGVALSTYPHFTFNSPGNAAQRGLVDNGTELLLPIEAADRIGQIKVNGEVGLTLESDNPDQWLYGLALGYDPAPGLELLGEVHGLSRTTGNEHELVWDIGARKSITHQNTLLFTFGTDLPGSTGGLPHFFGYLGVQLVR